MNFTLLRRAAARVVWDAFQDSTLQGAAALSYYTILCIFPTLILLSAIMALFPLPDFFASLLAGLARVFPSGPVMPMVYSVITGILGANLRAWFSLGTIGTLWLLSSAFDQVIESLNAAYRVKDSRPFWKTRLLALLMAAISGLLIIGSMAITILGPVAGAVLVAKFAFPHTIVVALKVLRRVVAVAAAIIAVQTTYYLAPNIKQRFRATLPGAILAVAGSMGLSFLLGIYFKYFANYNQIYGTLGGVMALMTWLYWGYFIFLVGGELNAELSKAESRDTTDLRANPHHDARAA